MIEELTYWKILTFLTITGLICVTITAIHEIKQAYKDRADLGELERLDQEVIDELLYFYKCMKVHEAQELKFIKKDLL